MQNFIARIPADGYTFIKMARRFHGDAKAVQAFDSFCRNRNIKLRDDTAPLTFARLTSAASVRTVLPADILEALEHKDVLNRADKLLRQSMVPTQAQELMREGLEQQYSRPLLFDSLQPDYDRAGVPLGKIRDDISEFMWDPTCGVVGIWKRIPAGRFMMGPTDAPKMQREVEIGHPFLMSAFQFTNGQALYVRFGRKVCEKAPLDCSANDALRTAIRDKTPFYFKSGSFGVGGDLMSPMQGNLEKPLIGITPETAELFAKFDGAILPSETQWEYAARHNGPKNNRGVVLGYRYPTGESILKGEILLAHVHDPRRPEHLKTLLTAPVGSYPLEDGSGLFDMGGNVSEITTDGQHSGGRYAFAEKGGLWSLGLEYRKEGDRYEGEVLETHYGRPSTENTFSGSTVGFRLAINLPH